MEFKELKVVVLLEDGSVEHLIVSTPMSEVPSVPSVREICLCSNLSRRFSTPIKYFIYNDFWFDLGL